MGKTLVLAEKPSVGRELARVLGCARGGDGYMDELDESFDTLDEALDFQDEMKAEGWDIRYIKRYDSTTYDSIGTIVNI